ncbi:MAG: hypothetical protein PHW83_11630 [Bacteroidales bacterium]|nr:hypothetical protein [Bacteroidales bacterium]
MKKYLVLLSFCLIIFLPLKSQELVQPVNETKNYNWGVETELLAWRIGKFPKSFYLGGWYGQNQFKYSLATGYFDLVPNHLPDSFTNYKTFILNLKCDYFFNEEYKNFWIGPSLFFEKANMISEENYKSELSYFAVGFSTGFLFLIKKLVYIGPSLQIHFPLGKHKYVISTDRFYYVPWSFEPGLRLGVKF